MAACAAVQTSGSQPTPGGVPTPFDLTGRTALVRGAGSPSGIGFACAALLGQLGADLAITSTTERIREREQESRRR